MSLFCLSKQGIHNIGYLFIFKIDRRVLFCFTNTTIYITNISPFYFCQVLQSDILSNKKYFSNFSDLLLVVTNCQSNWRDVIFENNSHFRVCYNACRHCTELFLRVSCSKNIITLSSVTVNVNLNKKYFHNLFVNIINF